MLCLFIDIYISIHGLKIDYLGFRKRAINQSLMTRQLILSTRGYQKIHNNIGSPPCTFRQLWHNVSVHHHQGRVGVDFCMRVYQHPLHPSRQVVHRTYQYFLHQRTSTNQQQDRNGPMEIPPSYYTLQPAGSKQGRCLLWGRRHTGGDGGEMGEVVPF